MVWRWSFCPQCSGSLKWNTTGSKFLRGVLGKDVFKMRNLEGEVDKMCAQLSKWKWLLPRLSYREKVFFLNNLIALALWHQTSLLNPPMALLNKIQLKSVEFFLSYHQWLRVAILYLLVVEGGQGLTDIESSVPVFRLQAAQRLLYASDFNWARYLELSWEGQVGLAWISCCF